MQEILFGYKLNPTTWAYISSLMMIGIYFKFHRFWSVRNLDLVGLILFTPGLLLIYHGLSKHSPHMMQVGYTWLFVIGGFFLVRLLLDPMMVRRPLLEPNLAAGGLTFTGFALLIFLMANVITMTTASTGDRERLEDLLLPKQAEPTWQSPGYALFYQFANFSYATLDATDTPTPPESHRAALIHTASTRSVVIFAHLMVVLGLVWIGYRHFDNLHTGAAAATLYLLSFYTSQLTSQMDHTVPAMLLLWALAAYRRPMIAGILLGLAAGMIYYPLFLLPLWCSFYWRRGEARFLFGFLLIIGLMVLFLGLSSADMASFLEQLEQMFGWRNPHQAKLSGFWEQHDPVFRYPVLAAFVVLSISLAIWPAQKNFGTLLSCSAVVMLATQFWQAHQGGLYMGWYLPPLILTIFRPNLEDRVAISTVREMWLPWWRKA
jgi:hypothetical protein